MGPIGDPWGTPWGPLGISWGPLGDPWGPLGIPRGSLGDHLETLGDVLGYLGHALAIPWGHSPVLLDASGASWGFFGGNLELQGALVGSQRGSRRPVGGLLGAFWKLRKCLRSNSLQYAKTFKFTVRYCKNRCPGRLKSLKINFKNTENRKLNNVRSKSDTGAAKMTPGRSQ